MQADMVDLVKNVAALDEHFLMNASVESMRATIKEWRTEARDILDGLSNPQKRWNETIWR